jgi:hypothetical protein
VASPGAPELAAAGGPAAVSEAPLLAAGVGIQEMIDAIQASVKIAMRQGIAHARIALAPAELGEIRIDLSQTAEGLLARVTAGSTAAEQALAVACTDLHSALSTLGTSPLRLDIASSGPQLPRGEPFTGARAGAAWGSALAAGHEQAAAVPLQSTAAEADGVLLDVLA